MELFADENVRLDVLSKRAYNYRWAEVPEGVIPLTAADPDFPAAPEIKRALLDYIEDGYFSYTPKMGFPAFREAIAEALWQRKQERITPNSILPIDSAARGMYIIAQTVLSPGDEMIIFDPVDYLFRESAKAVGATPVPFPAALDAEGYIDLSQLENYITPKTRMIGLCNPHNPLGCVYRVTDLEHIMQLCEKYNLYIMNDEIWSDIVYPDSVFTSIYALGSERCHRVMSVFGFSKSFGVAGLRVGCMYCTDDVLFNKLVDVSAVMTTAGGIASLSQVAGMTCVKECYYWVDAFIAHLTRNRDYAVERIAQMPIISTRLPNATYLLYCDISGFGMTSEAFCDFVKDEVKLALVPGGEKFFGAGSEGHLRICIATSFALLKEGLDRLERAIALLQERI